MNGDRHHRIRTLLLGTLVVSLLLLLEGTPSAQPAPKPEGEWSRFAVGYRGHAFGPGAPPVSPQAWAVLSDALASPRPDEAVAAMLACISPEAVFLAAQTLWRLERSRAEVAFVAFPATVESNVRVLSDDEYAFNLWWRLHFWANDSLSHLEARDLQDPRSSLYPQTFREPGLTQAVSDVGDFMLSLRDRALDEQVEIVKAQAEKIDLSKPRVWPPGRAQY